MIKLDKALYGNSLQQDLTDKLAYLKEGETISVGRTPLADVQVNIQNTDVPELALLIYKNTKGEINLISLCVGGLLLDDKLCNFINLARLREEKDRVSIQVGSRKGAIGFDKELLKVKIGRYDRTATIPASGFGDLECGQQRDKFEFLNGVRRFIGSIGQSLKNETITFRSKGYAVDQNADYPENLKILDNPFFRDMEVTVKGIWHLKHQYQIDIKNNRRGVSSGCISEIPNLLRLGEHDISSFKSFYAEEDSLLVMGTKVFELPKIHEFPHNLSTVFHTS